MLADFYIPRLSNDMKITVQKNHFCTEVWTLLKQTTSLSKSIRQKNLSYTNYLFTLVGPPTVSHFLPNGVENPNNSKL